MNILLIENQPLADTIKSKRTDIEVYGGLDLTAEEIAADIKSRPEMASCFWQTIVVPVYRIIKDKEGCRYYFRIDKKNFDKSASVITTHEVNKNGVCVKEGDVIFVKSGGDPKKPFLIIEDCQIIRS